MSKLVIMVRGRRVAALAIAGAAAALLAGCSSDTSTFSNPFQESARFGGPVDHAPTGSILPPEPVGQGGGYAPSVAAAPSARIASEPLAPVRPLTPAPVYHESASIAPIRPASPAIEAPGMSHAATVVKTDHGAWSADGGALVVVRPGESAATIATRYNVPLDVLMHVNGFVSAAQARPGSRVVIPVYSASSGQRDHTASVEPEHREPGRPEIARVERPATTKTQVARAEDASKGRETMHFVKGPTGAPESQERRTADSHVAKAIAPASKAGALQRQDVAAAKIKSIPQPEAHVAQAPVKATPPVVQAIETDHAATASLPSTGAQTASAHEDFRWPVRGRIIEGFRQGSNEGINIAVPDGTNVKAADDGVVAYAGNELKGYGNLVLIRHPNGFVTAYANNGEIDVHRGETVRRGQVIAKSGASGNVSSPQLHFELRKGQTPVDPTTYLAGS